MKKSVLAVFSCIALSAGVFAQEDMKTEWTKKFDHKTTWTGTGLEGPDEVSYIATNKEITVYNKRKVDALVKLGDFRGRLIELEEGIIEIVGRNIKITRQIKIYCTIGVIISS